MINEEDSPFGIQRCWEKRGDFYFALEWLLGK